MVNLLKLCFGKSTRSIQVFNFGIHLILITLLLLHSASVLPIHLPISILESKFMIVVPALVCVFAVIGFTSKGYKRQLIKGFSLLGGGLVQAVIANSYINEYPPFEPMVIACTIFAIWFLLAVLYIGYVEGINGIDETIAGD